MRDPKAAERFAERHARLRAIIARLLDAAAADRQNGAFAAGLHARTLGAPPVPAAAIGAGAAAVAARLGHDVRAGFSKRAPSVAATVEDEIALGLAIAGATR